LPQRHVDRPVLATVLPELPGAVQRVDDPDAGGVQPAKIVDRLLGEDGVGRMTVPDGVDQEAVRRAVTRGADSGAQRRLAPERQQQPAGRLGEVSREDVVVAQACDPFFASAAFR